MNINKVILAGRIAGSITLKKTNSGTSVATFPLATSETFSDKAGGKREETEFHNIVVWGKQAENVAQYCIKGQIVAIEGKNRTRKWQDQKSGVTHYRTEVIAEMVQFGPKPAGSASRPLETATTSGPVATEQPSMTDTAPDIKADDLPF